MTTPGSRLERITTVLLTVAIIAMAAVIVRREIHADRPAQDGLSEEVPSFVSEWEVLRTQGLRVGDPTAPVQVVEFVDLQCGACRMQHDALEALLSKHGDRIAVTYVHFPVSRHAFAVPAARAAECAHRQGALQSFLDAVYAKQDSLGLRAWDAYRRDAAIADSVRFASCMEDERVLQRVQAARHVGQQFGVSATPTMVVNGWRYSGALSFATLDDLTTRLLSGQLPQGVMGLLEASSGAGASRGMADGVPDRRYDTQSLELVPQLRLAPVPLAIAGDDDSGEFDLTNAAEARVLRNNHLVTYAHIGGDILVFGADGRGQRRIGRPGKGPGELERPTGVAPMAGDSLVVLDIANKRLVWATSDSGIVRERFLPRGMTRRPSTVVGVLPNKSMVLSDAVGSPPQDTSGIPVSSEVPVTVLQPDDVVYPIATLKAGSFVRVDTRFRGRRSWEMDWVRFAPIAHVAVWDSVIVTATGADYRLDLRDGRGRVIGVLEVDVPRRPVTEAMRRAEIARDLDVLHRSDGDPPVDAAESERLIRNAPFADSLPAIFAIQVASDNTLWVVDGLAPSDTSWTATGFRMDGSIVGRLQAEGTELPLAFGKDRVVLRHVDRDGVVTLRIHKIVSR